MTFSPLKFWDEIRTPPKGSHLLRGFLSKSSFIPRYSFPTWLVSRTSPFELPTLQEHQFTSHTTNHNILYVNKLSILFAGVPNSRSNSLQHGGHDIIQEDKQMTKDSRDNSHGEQSSQQSSQGPTKNLIDHTRRRTGHTPEHHLFFLLVFLKIKTCCK